MYFLAIWVQLTPAESGDVWAKPANCYGSFDPTHVVCRTNYDPDVHDQMFIRDIEQLGADSALLHPSVINAEDAWNDFVAGPQAFSIEPELRDSFNFVKAATGQQMFDKFHTTALGITMMCDINGNCTFDLGVPPGSAKWTEVWLNVDRATPGKCVPCQPALIRDTIVAHEFGHAIGLGHHGLCGDPNPTLMCDAENGLSFSVPSEPSATEGGSISDCKFGGDPDDDGLRCIYNWYNCFDIDCDGVQGLSDNCPEDPNETQVNTDGEIFDLGSEAVYDDVTSVLGWDSPGDVCDPDDDQDAAATSVELGGGCNGSGELDPLNDDVDNDGVLDGIECLLGSNPRDGGSKPPTTDDADHDPLPTSIELLFGTDPFDGDTDGDGLFDGSELLWYASNPDSVDTDGDGCDDAREAGTVNGDRKVTSIDLSQIAARFRPAGYDRSNHALRNYDVQRDGKINSIDMGIAAQHFGDCPPV